MSRILANSLLLLAAALWGAAFVAQSEAGAYLSAGWFTGLRFILAFLTVLPLGIAEARRAPGAWWQGVPELLPLAVVFAASTLLQQWALGFTSVTHAGFLTGLYVIFVPLLEMVFLRRAPHGLLWLAAVLALAGTWLLSGGLDHFSPGDGMIVLSALGFAVQILLMQRAAQQGDRPVAAALSQSAACVALGCVIGAAGGPLPWHAVSRCLPQLLYGGIVSGGIAFLLQALCQRYTGAAEAAVMLMAEALFAAIFAAILLHERLRLNGWLGCALLLAALVLAQLPALLPRRAARLQRV